jgi:hypothetical protein
MLIKEKVENFVSDASSRKRYNGAANFSAKPVFSTMITTFPFFDLDTSSSPTYKVYSKIT